MFQKAIDNIIYILETTDIFTLIIDYSDKIVKIVDTNEYDNTIIELHFENNEIQYHNEKYVGYPVDNIEQLNDFICKDILKLYFEMFLDEKEINVGYFKKINNKLNELEEVYTY